MKRILSTLALCSVITLPSFARDQRQAGPQLPTITTTALNGQSVSLPEDLQKLNVVIVGFTRGSADRTTAWEKPVRRELQPAGIQFFDIAVLEDVPKFMRGVVSAMIRNKVPTVLKPHFLMLYEGQQDWKRAVNFDPRDSDAAYVMIVNADGRVLWQTHTAFGDDSFDQLKRELKRRGMR